MKIQINFSSKMNNHYYFHFMIGRAFAYSDLKFSFLYPSLLGVISYDFWHFVGPCGCAHTRDHVNEIGRGFK